MPCFFCSPVFKCCFYLWWNSDYVVCFSKFLIKLCKLSINSYLFKSLYYGLWTCTENYLICAMECLTSLSLTLYLLDVFSTIILSLLLAELKIHHKVNPERSYVCSKRSKTAVSRLLHPLPHCRVGRHIDCVFFIDWCVLSLYREGQLHVCLLQLILLSLTLPKVWGVRRHVYPQNI